MYTDGPTFEMLLSLPEQLPRHTRYRLAEALLNPSNDGNYQLSVLGQFVGTASPPGSPAGVEAHLEVLVVDVY